MSQASRPRPDDLVRYLRGVMANQCNLSGIDIDGFFGDKTETAVKPIQKWNGLDQNGRCDAATWAVIDTYANI